MEKGTEEEEEEAEAATPADAELEGSRQAVEPPSGSSKVAENPASSSAATVVYHVQVPDGVETCGLIRFCDSQGMDWAAYVPPGLTIGQAFEVHMQGDVAFQPQAVCVPEGLGPGDRAQFRGLAGQMLTAVVPEGTGPGQFFIAWQQLQKFSEIVFNPSVWFPMQVGVPDVSIPGQRVTFPAPDGQLYSAHVPPNAEPGSKFLVYLHAGCAWQSYPVLVPDGLGEGDHVSFAGLDGRPKNVAVPVGVSAGQTFTAWEWTLPVPAPPPVEDLEDDELRAWLEAAKAFVMNEDFLLPAAEGDEGQDIDQPQEQKELLSYEDLLDKMKRASEGKATIQLLADKVLLSHVLNNMEIPQLPALMEITGATDVKEAVRQFIDDCADCDDPCAIFIKPSHLSNGTGVLHLPLPQTGEKSQAFVSDKVFKPASKEEKEGVESILVPHVEKFLKDKAAATESRALQSIHPGFLAQPRYQSVVAFEWPLELRVLVLWGKARLGIWWWCRNEGLANTSPQRNAWLVRHPRTRGEISDNDDWVVAHEHPGGNAGMECALKLLKRHMPAAAGVAEHFTTAIGAPFLRVDFFVGSPRWGVRLNEVAYGSSVEHRRFPQSTADMSSLGGQRLVDDSPAIARILQEGMRLCCQKKPREHFLGKVGVVGDGYSDMAVESVLQDCRLSVPEPLAVLQELARNGDKECEACSASEEQCRTPRSKALPTHPGGGAMILQGSQQSSGSQAQVLMAASPQQKQPDSQIVPVASGDDEGCISINGSDNKKGALQVKFSNKLALRVKLYATDATGEPVCELNPQQSKVLRMPHGQCILVVDVDGKEVMRWWPDEQTTVDMQTVSIEEREITAMFDNRSDKALAVLWIHPVTKKRHPCMELDVGKSAITQTYHSHKFVVVPVLPADTSAERTIEVDEAQGCSQRFLLH